MSAGVSTVIAAVSAVAALASAFLYLFFGRKSELAAAREEALDPETRRQVIVDLRAQLELLERRRKRMKADYERRARKLEIALDVATVEAREEAYPTQHDVALRLGWVKER